MAIAHRPSYSNRPNTDPDQRQRTHQDVLEMLRQYRQTGDGAIRDRIVMQYTNLVESIARRFSGTAEPVEDLAQEGYIGLITAIEHYDPTKNVKFSTYATHFIIGQIKHCLRDRGKIIKEPAWLQELNQRMTRIIEKLTQQLGRPPANLEIARMMDMTEEAVAELLMTRAVFKVTSIDGGSDDGDDSGGTIDMERKRSSEATTSFQLPVEDKIVLETAVHKLKELEQRVIEQFYFRDRSQTEIAKELGISCNYVSHILRNSTKKLKKILVTDELRNTQLKAAQARRRTDEQLARDEQITIVDDLTRLYNRHYYERRLEEELTRASRNDDELAIVFVQIGGLPGFARLHGTLHSDNVIQEAARRIRQCVRRSDIVTRYAGDTFAIILPATGRSAWVVFDRLQLDLRTWLAETGWQTGRTPLTLGMGEAVYPHDRAGSVPLTEYAQEQCDAGENTLLLRRAA